MAVRRLRRVTVRALIIGLAVLAFGLTILSFLPSVYLTPLAALWYLAPPEAPPPPPTILAPRAEMPDGAVGLQEWVKYEGRADQLVGSGFLLQVDADHIVGVTTAHSLGLGQVDHRLERIGFTVAGVEGVTVEFVQFYGPPGQARTDGNLSVDFVLLATSAAIDANLVLDADSRGAPQPGERVALFSGLGDSQGGRRILDGTVQTVTPEAVWVLFDESFEPGRMSGSPLISKHTGQAVGMAVAAAERGGRLTLGFHPIGSIMRLAQTAEEFPTFAEHRP